jgi:uncharacterized repeat protein (TIGR01451 family)
MRLVPALAAAVFALGLQALPASAEVEIEVRAQKETEVVTEDGETRVERVEADRVIPGDEVVYTITFRNKGEEPAENVRITNPIPEQLVLKEAMNGEGRTDVAFSVDGGAHYDAPDNLQIVDALGNARPAAPSDFTHIRWTILQPLSPGETGAVGFRAELQ